MKKRKIKKAVNGIQKVKDFTEDNQEGLGLVSQGVGMGITGLTQSKAPSKYTSQLKDSDQSTGKAIGNTVGQGLNLIAPGLGSIAAPVLGAVGGAIQTGLQKKKLEKIKTKMIADETNQAYNNQLGQPLLSQPQQFKKGGKTTSKVIEIEGKVTPEIHTDANFNLKNLGTTPHSKGGDKVVAEEGDVVFPTQNSPTKYKKIMKAINEKDLPTLKKEQAKLPADKGSKYPDGVKRIEGETDEQYRARVVASINKEAQSVFGKDKAEHRRLVDLANRVSNGGDIDKAYKFYNDDKSKPAKTETTTPSKQPVKSQLIEGDRVAYANRLAMSGGSGTSSAFSPNTLFGDSGPRITGGTNPAKLDASVKDAQAKGGVSNQIYGGSAPKLSIAEEVKSIAGGKPITPAETSKAGSKSTKKVISKKTSKPVLPEKSLITKPILGSNTATQDQLEGIDDPTALGEAARLKYEAGIKSGKYKAAVTPDEFMKGNTPPEEDNGKVGFKADANSAMELAPIAYNLGKGLFGKVEQVKRNYVNPQLEAYTDQSAASRAKSSQMYQAEKNNARNLSGGSIGNMRSNQQQASNSEVGRQADINNAEIARQDQINSRNTQVKNNAQATNLQLDNQYNEIDSANRAAKTGLLQAGLTGLSQLGARNILNQNAVDAQQRELSAYSQNSSYTYEMDEDGKPTGKLIFDPSKAPKPLQTGDMSLQDEQIKQSKVRPKTKKKDVTLRRGF